jgi:ribonuclease-3 family protein
LEHFEALLNTQTQKLNSNKLKDYNSLVFAYMGDSIHSLFVREYFILQSNAKAGALHLKTSQFVKASAQAKMLDAILHELTETELQIVKTARNCHQKTTPKNANLEDYKKASAFEALLGYLYLNGQNNRLFDLLNKTIKFMEQL